ncbi:MAG: thiamine phosphate synthase [Bacteroidales bacterium]|nr:thiamine phosphate synthase [Bacteroidales bacterium]
MRRLIGITPEYNVFSEHRRISNLVLSGEVEYFHIRKPRFTEEQMREYLSHFDNPFVKERLSLHDYHHLALELDLGGIHLNSRNPILKEEYKNKRISVSCHSLEEIKKWKEKTDYCFMSPIFDSISKQGYTSKFSSQVLQQGFNSGILDNKIVALGGVTYDNIKDLQNIGFSSFAMLGELWKLPKTMFISPNKDSKNIIKDCEEVLQHGIKFIQLRMKEASNDEVIEVANYLRYLCDKHCALLTVDDRIDLLHTNLFDGVHLGKNDMPTKEAKKITSNKFLLGATCNTIEDVLQAISNKADYLGIGPYRFTTTKKNLSPILGLEGYKNIIERLNKEKINIPFYAIGGIDIEDLVPLKQSGVYGIAISGTITNANNKQKTIKTIIKTF